MPIQSPEKNAKQIRTIEQRRSKLLRRITKLGPVVQGTITQRTIQSGDPDSPGTKKKYGPYYQWTWKREGKTVTVNVSASQVKRYQKAVDENRKLESLLQQLRAVSLELLEATTIGVPKRKRHTERS